MNYAVRKYRNIFTNEFFAFQDHQKNQSFTTQTWKKLAQENSNNNIFHECVSPMVLGGFESLFGFVVWLGGESRIFGNV